MSPATDALTAHLLDIVRRVRHQLGEDDLADDPAARFADLLDSMGMVEFVAILAGECGVEPAAIEECVNHRFGTVADLAGAMSAAGLRAVGSACRAGPEEGPARQAGPTLPCWLSATAVRFPETTQPAAAINQALGRPAGWFESHAGIESRRLWAGQDPLSGAKEAAADCLREAELAAKDVGALLVTSEAPPRLAGLGAALHHRLGLSAGAVVLEVGNACTGFLSALWAAESLLARVGPVLVVAVEAPSHFLEIRPGAAGETAALFGDGAAAALLCERPIGQCPVPLAEILLGVDGDAADLLRVERSAVGLVELRMDGAALAGRALKAMAEGVRTLAGRHGLEVSGLEAVVCHGGNGRLPGLLARQLGLPPERVWSETPRTGNLGSASLPAAWARHRPSPHGPVAWAAVGAGLTWGAALSGVEWE
ncbi:MAG TPA: 3-oxoacyl-[acyl-carrier-protein] synthase III C-terminal domain-containing protein [Gemmataceae bacterium]|nr:3-oxoacyl-[acyl-carrier-protein] synthase III C-terminal domain-containing protein [Gemmataceae bacterium]